MEEVWKSIDGWDGYEVSDLGRVRSLKSGNAEIMSQTFKRKGSGYLQVSLFRNIGERKSEKKKVSVHRLVCAAFHPNLESKPQVNHKDCNPSNNRKDNLEWSTSKENTQHAILNGRMDARISKQCKLSKEQVSFILSNYDSMGSELLGKKFGVSANVIWRNYMKNKGKVGKVTKKVININTKEIFKSAAIAAENLNVKTKYLQRRLNGERPNDTPFRYIDIYGNIQETEPIQPRKIHIPTEKKKPIAVFDMYWNELNRFDLMSSAAMFANVDRRRINDFLNGRCSMCNGYKFKLIGDNGELLDHVEFVSKKPVKKVKIKGEVSLPKRVLKYEINGDFSSEFESIGVAARSIGKDKKQFRRQVAKSKTGYCGGFNWKIVD